MIEPTPQTTAAIALGLAQVGQRIYIGRQTADGDFRLSVESYGRLHRVRQGRGTDPEALTRAILLDAFTELARVLAGPLSWDMPTPLPDNGAVLSGWDILGYLMLAIAGGQASITVDVVMEASRAYQAAHPQWPPVGLRRRAAESSP